MSSYWNRRRTECFGFHFVVTIFIAVNFIIIIYVIFVYFIIIIYFICILVVGLLYSLYYCYIFIKCFELIKIVVGCLGGFQWRRIYHYLEVNVSSVGWGLGYLCFLYLLSFLRHILSKRTDFIAVIIIL